MTKTKMDNMDRQTGIELLKIIAIYLIILSHVVQTLGSQNEVMIDTSYIIDFSRASTEWRNVLLAILRYSGVVGNTIFFVCSSWFLVESRRCNVRKWFAMLTEIWLISALIMVVVLSLGKETIGLQMLLKCLAPTIFANNWYLTCYLMFYPLHPYINSVLQSMSQKILLRWCMALFVVYFGLLFLYDGWLLGSHAIITWITIYFLVFYLKKYLPNAMDSYRLNVWIFVIAALLHLGSILFLNFFFGVIMPEKDDQLLRFCKNTNPFILIMVISMFNLARNLKLRCKIINKISGLSMLIYILHENILLRTYYRPQLLLSIHRNYGYEHVFIIVFSVSAGIFLLSAICAWLYQSILHKQVRRCSEKLLVFVRGILEGPEEWIVKLR